ncbi:threonine synthase [Bosea sp. Root381]|uniref:threonine synthase n=1 Tax=Bosea sp. Root381 TaxID=1736524 RepID=UPI000A59A356|nr:threonine synthase [Bosea sp. Root381]
MTTMMLSCVDCRAEYTATLRYACEECGGILEVVHAGGPPSDAAALVAPEVTLGEGGTPLLRARAGSAEGAIWIKDETRNPSGSFKDRLVSAALTTALGFGSKGLVCASSGNAGASAAAYAARAGIPAVILVPEQTPAEKMAQIAAYGALLVRVAGHYSNSYAMALAVAEETGFVNVTTTFINPYGTDALRLVGHEIHAQLGETAPDWVIVPTGSGPLVKGVVQGFADRGGRTPKIVAVQAEGCAPIVKAFDEGAAEVQPWGEPKTIASGISDPLIGYARDGTYTLRLVRESGGRAIAVSDDEIIQAMKVLAAGNGIFAEPTGASSLAAAQKLMARGEIRPGERVVCMVTGHGFKQFAIYRQMPVHEIRVEADAPATVITGALREITGPGALH